MGGKKREKRKKRKKEKLEENPCQGRLRELRNFAKTRKNRILYTHVVKSLILKINTVVVFAVKLSNVFL